MALTKADMAEKLRAFYARDAIVITRKTKRGEGQMDIVPAISELHVRPEARFVTVEAVVSAQDPTLNPDHLVAALHQLAPELATSGYVLRDHDEARSVSLTREDPRVAGVGGGLGPGVVAVFGYLERAGERLHNAAAVVTYIFMLVVLVVRPTGMFGWKRIERV